MRYLIQKIISPFKILPLGYYRLLLTSWLLTPILLLFCFDIVSRDRWGDINIFYDLRLFANFLFTLVVIYSTCYLIAILIVWVWTGFHSHLATKRDKRDKKSYFTFEISKIDDDNNGFVAKTIDDDTSIIKPNEEHFKTEVFKQLILTGEVQINSDFKTAIGSCFRITLQHYSAMQSLQLVQLKTKLRQYEAGERNFKV